MAPSLDYLADGTGADKRPAAEKIGDTVSVLDYIPASEHAAMKAGTSSYDASADYQDAIDANKGRTIVHPAGYTIKAAGMTMDGSTYDGGGIVVEGTMVMQPADGSHGFKIRDVDGFLFDCPGVIDGNRGAQPDSQFIFCLSLFGARNGTIPRLRCREIRGDALLICNKDNDQDSTNTSNIEIGAIQAWNSEDDGRNAVSIGSGDYITVDSILSIKIGSVIDGLRMPGGLDIEPFETFHSVRHVRIGRVVVETIGNSGIGIIGVPETNDAARDWNIQDVEIGSFSMTQTGGGGMPIFTRARDIRVTGRAARTGAYGGGVSLDYLDRVNMDLAVAHCAGSVVLGFDNWVYDFDINVNVTDGAEHSAGLVALGVSRGRFTGSVRAPGQSSAYGISVGLGSHGAGTVTQTEVRYSVDVPDHTNLAWGFVNANAAVSFGAGTLICDCAMTGFSTLHDQVVAYIPTRDVQGRNFATAVPSTGYWARGDRILNTTPSASGTPGWVVTTAGEVGAGAVFKAMANLAA